MSATSPDPKEIAFTIEERWRRGDSLGEAAKSVKRLLGVEISTAEVQRHYVRFDRQYNQRA